MPVESWAVALHGGPCDEAPLGAGIVVADSLVLACEHVAFHQGRPRELWVAFPRAFHVPPGVRRRVRACSFNGRAEAGLDVVLLELEEPVPAGVAPARLRRPSGPDLVGRSWRAFGFPQHSAGGRPAAGRVGGEGGYGRIQLEAEPVSGVTQGFSGAALWSPDYDAVVGIILAAESSTGSGHALTLAYADEHLPGMKLSTLDAWRVGDADELTHAAWGWTLAADGEAGRHWLPRARGVASGSETGSRFRGRSAALRRLRDFLDRPQAAGRPLVVTGSPGVGKSAVLGRVVTTADAEIHAALPADDVAERATVGSVACAVHVKGKTALEVACEIARGTGAGLPAATVDLLPALRHRLAARPARVNVVVDALDEAATPADTRELIDEVLVPLARTCHELGAQVVVGTRRSDDRGDLLAAFGSDAVTIDLDAPEYFSSADLADYAQATLQSSGVYADPAVAAPVAARIAALADRNFLIAGLVARTRALRDLTPVDPVHVSFTPTVGDTLHEYVRGLTDVGVAPARLALSALAYAETPGLPLELWQAAVGALGASVTAAQLSDFARTSAANFLVETGDPARPIYRLFHQALNDALLAERRTVGKWISDEQRLVRTWTAFGREAGWSEVPEYLLRSLPQHAARAGAVDELLNDDDYLLHAHLDRLLPVAGESHSWSGQARRRLLQRTPQAFGAAPADRAALFSVVDRLDDLRVGIGSGAVVAPYQARWAHTPPRLESAVLDGHSLAVHDVCAIAVDGRHLLASAGEEGTVRLWDPLTNQTVRVIACHDDCIRGVCAVEAAGGTYLATASHDGTIGIWDPRSGIRLHSFTGHGDWVRNLVALPVPGGDLLASAGDDRTVRIWDVAGGIPVRTLTGHTGWVTAVTHVPVEPYGLLASTGTDGTVRLWDPLTGADRGVLRAGAGWLTTLYPVRDGDRVLLAAAGYDGVVRLWDPLTRDLVAALPGAGGLITDLCTVRGRSAELLAATCEDGTVRLWDVATRTERPRLHGHASWIRAVCELPMPGQRLLATAGEDGTVRLWNPEEELPRTVAASGFPGAVADLSAVRMGGDDLVVSAGSDGVVRLYQLSSGELRGQLRTHAGAVNAVDVVEDDDIFYLAAACRTGTVELWDLADGELVREFRQHSDQVKALAVLRSAAGLLVASAGEDETIRLWDPRTAAVRGRLGHRDWVTSLLVMDGPGGAALASGDNSGVVRFWRAAGGGTWEQHGHQGAINVLCEFRGAGRTMLVSAGADRSLRLWDPADGRLIRVLTGHTAAVTGLDVVDVAGQRVLVSASLDRTVRLWDLRTGRALRVIPVHHRARACRRIGEFLVVGLEHGLLALILKKL
ncbi:WD40 repeat domain-containing protein [Actinoplanes siamensis]|nr:WD40 repeat domain-containing protein [Actinoplanes siamensis]